MSWRAGRRDRSFDPDLLQSRLAWHVSARAGRLFRLGARKAVADVMGQRAAIHLASPKLANDGGYAADKFRAVFGDEPVNSILGELDKQGQIRATNNLASAVRRPRWRRLRTI